VTVLRNRHTVSLSIWHRSPCIGEHSAGVSAPGRFPNRNGLVSYYIVYTEL